MKFDIVRSKNAMPRLIGYPKGNIGDAVLKIQDILNTLEDQSDIQFGILSSFLSCYQNNIIQKKRQWSKIMVDRKNGGMGWLSCFDHPFVIPNTKGHVFGFEPYGLTLEDLKGLVGFAEKNNLSVLIDGMSDWFPCRTISVIFKKKLVEQKTNTSTPTTQQAREV